MSLRHAILVLLQDQEASGYDLAREFANSIGLVWNATHQQIYLELGKLNERHMVSFRLLGELEQLSKQRRERLATFEALAQRLDEQGREENLYSYLTVRRGILDQRAWLQWAEEVRQALEHASVGLPTS